MAYEQNLTCFGTFGQEQSHSLATYEKNQGYAAWRNILAGNMTPAEVIDEVKASGLRGRGGKPPVCVAAAERDSQQA